MKKIGEKKNIYIYIYIFVHKPIIGRNYPLAIATGGGCHIHFYKHFV